MKPLASLPWNPPAVVFERLAWALLWVFFLLCAVMVLALLRYVVTAVDDDPLSSVSPARLGAPAVVATVALLVWVLLG